MALVLGQGTAGTAATFITTVPPGPYHLTLVTGGTAVAIGTSTTTTLTNGALIPANGSVVYTGFTGATGAILYGISANGTATTVSYHLCTAE